MNMSMSTITDAYGNTYNYSAPYDVGNNKEYRPMMRYKNGCTYQGEINKSTGKREGLGTLTRADGSFYFGTWKDGKRHGRGREVMG